MRVLFDQGTPVPLRRLLAGHDVSTAYEFGWIKAAAEVIAAAVIGARTGTYLEIPI